MEFKDKLRNLRIEAGLSQEALADIVHVFASFCRILLQKFIR